MLAVAKGGTSVYGADKTTDLLFLPVVAMQHGLGKFTYADLNKALAGKQVSLQLALDDYTRSLSGNTTPKDLKTYMEMLYMTFTGLNVTADVGFWKPKKSHTVAATSMWDTGVSISPDPCPHRIKGMWAISS